MATEKYLQKYAEPEIRLLNTWPDNRYRHTLVIPCYRESPDFLQRLLEQFPAKKLLLVLVVNQPDSDTSANSNRELLQAIEKLSPPAWQNRHLSLRPWGENGGLLLVERWRETLRIPRKQGVGLARRIGCDIAAQLHHRGFLCSPWIHSTDADARLPDDYFEGLPDAQTTSAALYPFAHDSGHSPVHQALQLYEQALHYYVENLRRAGSPWAYHTIGSILAISARHYCAARGFPKKAAGEDFYLLNKLGKLAPVAELTGRAPVRIAARLSDRVPFGTGPATAKIAGQLESGEEPTWYAPQVFGELRNFLNEALEDGGQVCQNPRWREALEELGWQQFTNHCRQQKLQGVARETAFHHWFDAFRTLRFIHLMQRRWHPPRPLRELLAQTTSVSQGT
ncbi:hypothetical protein [Microbulbifer sp.]|uniref:hypothetical protein n=1 Tax=Microbulbifer sp. TaxID=1908541 RepID=UPI003F3F3963